MGYSVYEDRAARDHGVLRWAGYMVPAECDFPTCDEEIDRGLAYRCEEYVRYEWDEDTEEEFEFEEEGCGLSFCGAHQYHPDHGDGVIPKPDTKEWVEHILTDESWEQWRAENSGRVALLRVEAGWVGGKR